MSATEHILNEFYQGLHLLVEFETGQTRGAMSSPFYAINKVVAHLSAALDEGNAIAPFFLHYLANKFPESVDKSQLPDLARVPEHKSKASLMIRDYQTFLNLHEEIQVITQPRVIECSNARQARTSQQKLQDQTKQVQKKVMELIKSGSILGGVFGAKLLELFQEKTNRSDLNNLIAHAMEQSAFHPDVYAMYECSRFLNKKGMRASTPGRQAKLQTELALLAQHDGDINALVEHYKANPDDRYVSQWLFQSAIHGRAKLAKFMMDNYIFNDGMQWHDKISNDNKLAEAIKWFDWYEKHASRAELREHWQEIGILASSYEQVIGQNKYKASFLCYAVESVNKRLLEEFNKDSHEEFIHENQDLLQKLYNFRGIISLSWSLNRGMLPSGSSSIVINEMATIFEERKDYKQAERLYRRVLGMEGSNPIYQFNLANILDLQNKNQSEMIDLYLVAAKQGCGDSAQRLFKLLVIDGNGSLEQMERLKLALDMNNFEKDIQAPKNTLHALIIMAIYQRFTQTKLFQWETIKKDGRKFYNITFDNDQKAPLPSPEIPENSSVDAGESSCLAASSACETPASLSETGSLTPETHTETRRSRLFRPADSARSSVDSGKTRAMKKLNELNSKPLRTLNIKDFIQAQKAYQVLMGQSVGIDISTKGKSSGSRAKVGGAHMHLTHGRDRMSIGAQSEIRENQ